MAEPTAPIPELVEQFGPHPQRTPPGGWQDESRHPAERLVKTHCCFCGQQCGIQLKVRQNQVIGFEPWEEFPFNRGMLCPKGVKRYLQSGVVDFFLSETAHFADVVLAGSLHEEDEGVVANVEGRVLHIPKAVDPPGN